MLESLVSFMSSTGIYAMFADGAVSAIKTIIMIVIAFYCDYIKINHAVVS